MIIRIINLIAKDNVRAHRVLQLKQQMRSFQHVYLLLTTGVTNVPPAASKFVRKMS